MTIERDRRRTFPLLQRVTDAHTSEVERDKAFDELGRLDDYRSIEPLTAMMLDTTLPEEVRRRAAEVVADVDDTSTGEIRRAWWATGDPLVMRRALRSMRRSEADIVVPIAADNDHPLQIDALAAMEIGFGEAEFVPVLVRALHHHDAKVRKTAAFVLLWEEPVAAEVGLLDAAHEESIEVAEEAMNTLHYYPSQRVLRAMSDLRNSFNARIRTAAALCFDDIASGFEDFASSGDPKAVARLRDWMRPVADLVQWTDRAPQEPGRPRLETPRPAIPEDDLLDLIDASDAAAVETGLRGNYWAAYDRPARTRLTPHLATHPDPLVREIACTAFTAWAKTDELLELTRDRHRMVRKSAMYSLSLVPADPAVADYAWQHLPGLTGTMANEALCTYLVHAPVGQPPARLRELAHSDPREALRHTAIHQLAKLEATEKIRSLLPLLQEPPGVTWAVHLALLRAIDELDLPTPPLHHLTEVDNLHLQSALADLHARG
ncbi:HEAT repeat domain-containing protein [Nocardia sp. XZ_19_385]|uniref:HEAT repeat domain-containing protein n=1 Tax=Nocardia sp. XZ_19_385 TaxID=2769488 RepID=UPI0018908898|nr:hypothetical protein [Nocardia sp. XZ_19_385]